MKTYSIDLRKRIIEACESGTMTQAAVAERFGVSFGFVRKLLTQWREIGDLAQVNAGGAVSRPSMKRRCGGCARRFESILTRPWMNWRSCAV